MTQGSYNTLKRNVLRDYIKHADEPFREPEQIITQALQKQISRESKTNPVQMSKFERLKIEQGRKRHTSEPVPMVYDATKATKRIVEPSKNTSLQPS